MSLFWSLYLICTVHWCQEQNHIYTKSFALNSTFPCKYSICSKQVNNLCSCDFPSVLLHITAQDTVFGVPFSFSRLPLITHYRQDLRGNVSKVYWYSNVIVILQLQLWHKNWPLFSECTMLSLSALTRICWKVTKMILSSLRVFGISGFFSPRVLRFYFIVSDGFIVSTLVPLVCLVSQVTLRVLLRFTNLALDDQ